MKRFIEGLDRSQTTLLPDCVDEYVGEDNPVRAVDAFVDMLDLAVLGFDGVEPEATGRPGYHPATMLKLYVYGYLNQVQSSRRLERECARNLELIWLLGRLTPDFKTIADFRTRQRPRDPQGLPRSSSRSAAISDLLDASLVAIDGSKFKAVNAKAKITREKLRRRLGEIDAAIDRYMGELDRADEVVAKTGMHSVEARLSRGDQEARPLPAKRRARLQRHRATDGQHWREQVYLTDPDCRGLWQRPAKQPRVVG